MPVMVHFGDLPVLADCQGHLAPRKVTQGKMDKWISKIICVNLRYLSIMHAQSVLKHRPDIKWVTVNNV